MKIQETDAISIAKNLMKNSNTPYDTITATYVEKQKHWLVAFEGMTDKAMMDGNVSFVTVDAETGQATLKSQP